jgi:hypothetical protein
MRRGWIEPPSARPVALRSSAIYDSGPRLSGRWLARAASRFDASSPHRVVASTPAWGAGLMPPTVPASSSRRGRSTPRAVPEASREWIVTSPAGAALIPTNGIPPDGCPSGMRWREDRGGVEGRGLLFHTLPHHWSPLWQPSTSSLIEGGVQDVDARDKPEHDGEANRDASSLLPDGRRWREAPDEGVPLQQDGATVPSRSGNQRRAHPATGPGAALCDKRSARASRFKLCGRSPSREYLAEMRHTASHRHRSRSTQTGCGDAVTLAKISEVFRSILPAAYCSTR